MPDPVLEARDVVKTFGRVQALRGANFTVYPREVVALVGDNGAGKSTLVKTLVGVHPPDSGEILFDGRPVQINTPHDARDLGISVVLISHNMPEVFEVADRIEVLRLGQRVARLRPKEVSMEDIVAAMTGATTFHEDGGR